MQLVTEENNEHRKEGGQDRRQKRKPTREERAREILERALARLSRRNKWIVGAEVTDVDGVGMQIAEIPKNDLQLWDNAPMCAIGAIRYEAWLTGDDPALAEEMLARAIDPAYDEDNDETEVWARDADETITTFNDDQTQKRRVLDKFRKALKV